MPDTDSFDSLLGSFKPVPGSPHALTIQKALFVARSLQERARELQTPPERRQQAELDRMLQTPRDKATLAQMTDQAFRSQRSRRGPSISSSTSSTCRACRGSSARSIARC